MSIRVLWLVSAAAAVAFGACDVALAQDAPTDAVEVPAGDISGNSGRIAVNLVAGSENQQASSALVAQGDVAALSGILRQAMVTLPKGAAAVERAARVNVEDNAFSNNSGLISINLTAGSQNQSANLAALAIGTSGAISDQLLEQSRASIEPSGATEATPASSDRSVAVGDGAFADSSGVLQVNLIGGERNSSANIFSLNISAGGQP